MAEIDPVVVERIRRKRAASRWALYSNGALLGMKVAVGAVTGSVAILAEVVNSAADLVGALIVFFTVKHADEPPDETHAYGHGKIENLSGVVTGTLIVTGAFITVVEAVSRFFRPERLVGIDWAIAVMCFSAVLNAFVSSRLLAVGRQTESPALEADGRHLRTDVLTSVGVLVGLFLVHVTGLRWWDSIAALAVSTLILRVGVSVSRESLNMLVDRALPHEEVVILEKVLRANPKVRGFHRLRTRKAGSQRHADVHVMLDDECTLVVAHRISEDLEDEMRAALPNLDAMVHPEPYAEETIHQREIHGFTDQNMTPSA